MRDVECIIVTFDSAATIGECLTSIQKYLPQAKVTVVDNASVDGTTAVVESLAGVNLVQSGANLGYAGALNMAIRKSAAKVLLIVNPDVVFHSSPVPLIERLDSKTWVTGPKLWDSNGIQFACARRLPSAGSVLIDQLRIPRTLIKILRLKDTYISAWDHRCSRVVEALSGACFAILKSTWNEVGGMSEDGFMYYEDIDFFRRIRHAGGTCLYLPEVSAFHVGAGSSQTVEPEGKVRRQLGAILLFGLREPGHPRYWRGAIAAGQLLRGVIIGFRHPRRARRYLLRAAWVLVVSEAQLTQADPLHRVGAT